MKMLVVMHNSDFGFYHQSVTISDELYLHHRRKRQFRCQLFTLYGNDICRFYDINNIILYCMDPL